MANNKPCYDLQLHSRCHLQIKSPIRINDPVAKTALFIALNSSAACAPSQRTSSSFPNEAERAREKKRAGEKKIKKSRRLQIVAGTVRQFLLDCGGLLWATCIHIYRHLNNLYVCTHRGITFSAVLADRSDRESAIAGTFSCARRVGTDTKDLFCNDPSTRPVSRSHFYRELNTFRAIRGADGASRSWRWRNPKRQSAEDGHLQLLADRFRSPTFFSVHVIISLYVLHIYLLAHC